MIMAGDIHQVEICWFLPEAERDLFAPRYETAGASGLDVQAAISDPVVIAPGEIVLIPTGFGVALPEGYEFQVRPRSGLAVRHGIGIANSPGTIDADYRGEIRIALINFSRNTYTVQRGERIAQLVLAEVSRVSWREVERLPESSRGANGFGHTGR
jgi:dUTP pyrophosphatase